MTKKDDYPISRRNFIKVSAATTAGVSMMSLGSCNVENVPAPMKRKFGKHDFMVTTLGLGGQASLQWTPDDEHPASIIVKAFELGINYFDTSNAYALSQLNYNEAFQQLNLIPGKEGYDEELRKSIWLTTKSGMRYGNPGTSRDPRTKGFGDNPDAQCVADDLKRSMTQLFGDGNGSYPEDAYLDMILCHAIGMERDLDTLYLGLETPLDPSGDLGALVVLRDFRDGTNLTGMNPKNEKLIKHIGFSGHESPEVMMDMIQRDEYGILDGMLVSINANDKQKQSMQHNCIPVAEAKGMGIIGMKAFADAAMYHKEPRWSQTPDDVFRKVGTTTLPSRPLIEYSLTTPGVHTLIVGIGHIDEDPLKCQLIQNYYAAQIEPNGMTTEERNIIEKVAAKIKEGKTNYFTRVERSEISAPRDVQVENTDTKILLKWNSAIAGDDPVSHYEVLVEGKLQGKVDHKPQTLKSKPFSFEMEKADQPIVVAAVDAAGNRAEKILA